MRVTIVRWLVAFLAFLLVGLGPPVHGHSAAVQDPAASKGGVVRGTVQSAETGSPLADVEVTLRSGNAQRSFVAKTDANGRYEIRDVPPGHYRAMFAKPGHVSLSYGQSSSLAPPQAVVVRPGLETGGIGAQLPTAGAIEGRVTDEKGSPVADAIVMAFRFRGGEAERRLTPVGRKVTTDDRGQYRIFGLDPGDYYVGASLGGPVFDSATALAAGKISGYAPTFYPSSVDPDGAARVSVRSPGDVTADITFQRVRLARLTGKVVTTAAVEGVLLSLVNAGLGTGTKAATAARDGEFEISGIPPGSYILQARAMSEAVVNEIAMTGRSAPLAKNPDVQYGVLPVLVNGADISGVVVQTVPGGRLGGIVMLDGQPHTGKPIQVVALPANPHALAVGPSAFGIDAEGRFSIGGLLGTFVLRLRGLAPGQALSRVVYKGNDVSDSGVTLESGEAIDDVTIEVSASPARLVGRIRPPDTTGLECQILLFSADERRWATPASRHIAIATTNEGAFEFIGLPAGNYYAVALHNLERGQEQDPNFLKSLITLKRTRSVSVSAGLQSSIDLSPK